MQDLTPDRVRVATVEEELRRITGSLPDGAATLSVQTGDSPRSRNLIILPSNPAAAQIQVQVEEDADIVGVTIGRAAVFEIPREGHRYSNLPFLDELRAICLAAVRGEVEETVWFKGEDVVGGAARARIGSQVTGDSWRQLFTNPLRRPTKKSFVYEPYV